MELNTALDILELNKDTNEKEMDKGYVNRDQNLVYGLMDKLEDIYIHIEKRNNIESWKEVLREYEIKWDVSNKSFIEMYLFDFLTDHKDCPGNVYKLFNTYAGWTEAETSLNDRYDESLVKYILHRVNNPDCFKENYVDKIPSEKLLEYLRLREEAFYDLHFVKNGNSALAKIYDLLYIYDMDYYVLNLKAEYFINRNESKKAIEVLDKSILINSSRDNIARKMRKELKNKIFFSDKNKPMFYVYCYIVYRILVFIVKTIVK